MSRLRTIGRYRAASFSPFQVLLLLLIGPPDTPKVDAFKGSNATFRLSFHSSPSSQSRLPPTERHAMPENWSNASMRREALQRCFVPLSSSSHKGSSGRIGVIGGSARYTGAPYYAAMASLKAGADLAFVFCAQEAALPIKSYSPELMVAPVYRAVECDQLVNDGEGSSQKAEAVIASMVQEVSAVMDKLHVLVIGPGLGRCPIVLEATSRIISEARSKKLPLVLDADALYLMTLGPYQRLLQEERNVPVVLTPNAVESKRLQGMNVHWSADCIIVEKGNQDGIHRADIVKVVCNEEGGLKRPGGLGDVLAGTLGAFVAWNGILTKRGTSSMDDLPLSCWTACCMVKRATHRAFKDHRRSMTAPDVLAALGSVVNDITAELDFQEN